MKSVELFSFAGIFIANANRRYCITGKCRENLFEYSGNISCSKNSLDMNIDMFHITVICAFIQELLSVSSKLCEKLEKNIKECREKDDEVLYRIVLDTLFFITHCNNVRFT